MGEDIEKATKAFLPYMDMLNHQNKENIFWGYHPQENGVLAKAKHDIPRGSEVFNSYGHNQSNRDLFVNYGFVTFPNPNDLVGVHLGLSKDDPLYKEKVSNINIIHIA